MKKALFALLLPALAATAATVPPENLIVNGSFENGLTGWSYEEWKGLPPPGQLSEDHPFAGKKCFVMSEPGKMQPRYLRTGPVTIDRNRNYLLRVALSTRDVVPGSIKVRILQYGAKEGKKTPVVGWLAPNRPGVHDLIPDLTGSTDWKTYEIRLPGTAFDAKTQTAAVFFQHLNPGMGELKIDAVELSVAP